MIKKILTELKDDSSTPRPIKKICEELMELLGNGEVERLKGIAVQRMEKYVYDPNIPMHVRTLMFKLLSEIEALKKI